MLSSSKVFTSFSVSDLQAAKEFYGNILGLDVKEEEYGLALTLTGGASVFLYPKTDHQPATFTVLNFPVDDIDSIVQDLAGRGIRFEQYGGDIQTDLKGIFRGSAKNNGPDIAWFKDPAGNILSVVCDIKTAKL